MLDRAAVTVWLDAYVHAWKTYHQKAIGDLFSEDASYSYSPFSELLHGRDAIVTSWLEQRDPPGTYDGHYANGTWNGLIRRPLRCCRGFAALFRRNPSCSRQER